MNTRLVACSFLLTILAALTIPANATNSVDGSSLLPVTGGSLTTSAGNWTFGGAGSGGNLVLLDGNNADGGSGTEMFVGNGGNLYVVDNEKPGHWYEWNTSNSTWIHLYAVSPFPDSANGATMVPGGQTDLVTSAGIWAFGAPGSKGNLIELNGAQASNGRAVELVVANSGQLYQLNSAGDWYVWSGSSWTSTSNPNGGFYAACGTAAVVGLKWSAVNGATTYNITRGGATIETGTPLLYYNDQSVAASTSYSYVLSAMNGSTTVSTQDLGVTTSAATPDVDAPYCPSTVISGITWNWSTGFNQMNNADIWDTTWGNDGNTYLFFGDGAGFWGTNAEIKSSFGIAELSLTPPAVGTIPDLTPSTTVNILNGYKGVHTQAFYGKLNGIVAIGSSFYGIGNIYESSDKTCTPTTCYSSPNHTEIAYSSGNAYTWQDNGTNWQFCNDNMGPTSLCAVAFINFGKGVGTASDGYVYLLGQTMADFNNDGNGTCANGSTTTTCAYLMRVTPANILTYANYQIFAGYNSNGTPNFVTNGWGQEQPIYVDSSARQLMLGKIVYNAGLGRYIGLAQGDVNQDAFFDAPNPWGPWTTFAYYQDNPSDFTGGWGDLGTMSFNGGSVGAALGINFLNEWTSSNGLGMWATFSSNGDGATGASPVGLSNGNMDSFNIVSVTLTLF